MRGFLLAATAAAMTFSGVAASAQDWRYDRDHDRYRYEHRGYDRGAYNGRWSRGQVYPYYARRDRIVDWRRYHLSQPYPGYAWYRDDDGSYVMAALASGIIGMALAEQYGAPRYYAPPPQPYYYPY